MFGTILDGKTSYNWLIDALESVDEDAKVALCSAYLKYDVVERILTGSRVKSGRVLARWQKKDFISGASDLQVFELLDKRGWHLYLDTSFHGKVYALSSIGILIGSANATMSGFGLRAHANKEICTVVEYSQESSQLIDMLFEDATLVDRGLFELLCNEVSLANKETIETTDDLEWSDEIRRLIANRPRSKLFVKDLFWDSPRAGLADNRSSHDLDLLGLSDSRLITDSDIQKALRSTKFYLWLRGQFSEDLREIWFGRLTQLLHESLADDPTPYRSTIKDLLSKSVDWVGNYLIDEFQIDRPNYSQRIRLTIYDK